MASFEWILRRTRRGRERTARRRAVRPAPAPRRRFALEPLEPRLLLSADIAPLALPNLLLTAAPPLVVTSLQATPSGFTAQFDQPLDRSTLNLYDSEAGGLGAPDVTVIGQTRGPVTGSLVVDDGGAITFVRAGGVLAPDTYTITLRGAPDGFRAQGGGRLDGNGDGTEGDDFVTSFTVAPVGAVVVSVPDFARGPAQRVDVPGPAAGLPITLSNGDGVTSVVLTLVYDPALLEITGVTRGAGLPAGTLLQSDFSQPGVLTLGLFSPTPMGPGVKELVRLGAEVAPGAPYGQAGLLDLSSLAVNGGALPALGDDGVQLVAYLGDTTGNQRYSALDGTRALRVVVGLDSGFAVYPLIDPIIVADITGNGGLSAQDGTRILQEVVGLDREEISPITPVIRAGLSHDTGRSATDRLTFDPAITGTVSDDGAIALVQARVDAGVFVDVTGELRSGIFALDRAVLEQSLGGPLADGVHTLQMRAVDDDGHPSTVVDFTFTLDQRAPAPGLPTLLPSSDTGDSSADGITADATPTIRLFVESGASVDVLADGAPIAQGVAANGVLDLTLPALPDGLYELTSRVTDAAGNLASSTGALPIRIDATPPALVVSPPGDEGTITPGARLTGSVAGTGSDLLRVTYRFDGRPTRALVPGAGGAFDQALTTSGLTGGEHTLTVAATDVAGNTTSIGLDVVLEGIPFAVTGVTPVDGAEGVGVGVHPRINFSAPVAPETLTGVSFFAIAGGDVLAARIVVDPAGLFARLFFDAPMPGGADVQVIVVGSEILARSGGVALDADGDGLPGGDLLFRFITASTVALPGTGITGRIADSGPDMMPLTADDTLPGPDGLLGTPDDVVLLPLAGVKTFVRGLEGAVELTGTDGVFAFEAAPTGAVTLTLQGEFASGPAGTTFPELNAELTLVGGRVNDIGTIYMPRFAAATVQTVSNTAETVLTLPPEGALGLTEAQRQLFTLALAPGSLLDADGLPVGQAQVVMSLAPSEAIRPFLPAAMPEPTLVFTTQLRGASDITTPFRATFPNLTGANVGDRFAVMSFDPVTGKLVRDGTAVAVSSAALRAGGELAALDTDDFELDGDLVIWDPGDEGGLVACFHVLLPDGGPVDAADCDPDLLPSEFVFPVFLDEDTFKDQFLTSDNGSFRLHFENAAEALNPAVDPCDPENQEASPLKVVVTLDQPELAPFIDGLGPEPETFYLYPQEAKDIPVLMRRLLDREALDAATSSRLLGATISLKGTVIEPESGVEHVVFDQRIFVYRLWDIADNDHQDGTLEFERTLVDGRGSVRRDQPLALIMPESARPIIAGNGAAFDYVDAAGALDQVRFDPESEGVHGGGLKIVSPNDEIVGTILLQGRAILPTNIVLSRTQFLGTVSLIVDSNALLNPQWDAFRSLFGDDLNGNLLLSDEAGFPVIANAMYDRIVQNIETVGYGFDPEVAAAINVTGSGAGIQLNALLNLEGASDRAIAESPWVDFNRPAFNDMVDNQSSMSLPHEKFQLASFPNLSATDPSPKGYQGVALILSRLAANLPDDPFLSFTTLVSNTIAHEVGHVLGMIHMRAVDQEYIYGPNVMGSGSPQFLQEFGIQHRGLVKAALGVPMTDAEFAGANDHYQTFVNRETYAFSVSSNVRGEFDLEQRLLTVFDAPVAIGQPEPNRVTRVDFGTVLADGGGAESGTVTLVLFNNGEQDLTVSSIALPGGAAGFSIEGVGPLPRVLPALDPANVQPARSQHAITVRFDPLAAGPAQDVLRIVSDHLDGVVIEIPLAGRGLAPVGDIVVEAPANNLGGATVGGAGVASTDAITLRNVGAADLAVTGITITDGAGQFSLTGLAAAPSPGAPLVIAPGAAVSVGAAFAAAHTGLQRAHVRIASDDPETPVRQLTLVGTGLAAAGSALDYGDDYLAVQQLGRDAAPVLRQRSEPSGSWSVYLGSDQPFRHTIFDPVSGLIHATSDVTAAAGESDVLMPVFRASTAPDRDGDGLPDDVEFAIGSSSASTDTDADGVDDFAEIAAGDNPLDGVAGRTGVIAALGLSGQAWDVTVTGSTAYVATGGHGLAIVDVSRPDRPTLLGALDLAGFNVAVAVDEGRGLAAVADDGADPRLHVIDVSVAALPVSRQSVPLPGGASHVEILDGVAYVASGTAVVSVELVSGEVLHTLELGAVITGLAREGTMLLAMDAASTLHAIGIGKLQMTVRDSLTVAHGGGQLFVGGGVAYLANESGVRGGFATVDVSDPDDLALLSGSDTSESRPSRAVAADGSGRALIVGSAPDPQRPGLSLHVVDVASVTDPADTNAYVARFALPEFPLGLALASGVALVADGSADLLVVGYASPDVGGQAPVVALSATVEDADPTTPGVQVADGTVLPLRIAAADDTLVRQVALLADGEVVATDASFPHEALLTVRGTSGVLTLQARATDIGGNVASSNVLIFHLVPDTTAPAILGIIPPDGAALGEGLRTVQVRFTEALAADTATMETFRVVNGLGQAVLPSALVLRSEDRVVELSYAGLPAGSYQLVIAAAQVTDRAGNALGATDVTSAFTLTGATIRWASPTGGFWDVAANWDLGRVPGPDDSVLIDIANDVGVIEHRTGTSVITSLVSREPIRLTGGTLEANGTIRVDSTLRLMGGTLRRALVQAGAGLDVSVEGFSTLDDVTFATGVDVARDATARILNGLALDGGRIEVLGGDLLFEGTQALSGSGEIFFSGTDSSCRVVASQGTLTIASGIVIDGDQGGALDGGSVGLILEGMVAADAAGKTIRMAGTWTNNGVIRARNGVAELAGAFTLGDRGRLDGTAGTIRLVGTLDNTDKTLVLDAATGSLFSAGGTLKGGRLETADGAALVPQVDLTLDGVTLGTPFTIPDGTDVLVRNGLTLDNVAVTLTDGTVAFVPARMRFLDSSTLGGTGEILFAGTGDANSLVGTTNFTLTIGPNITVRGPRGGTVGVLGHVVNQGTISAETNLREISISGTSVSNQGTLRAFNGGDILLAGGPFTTTGLVDIGAAGSQVRVLAGTYLQNAGETRIGGGTLIAATVSIQGGVLSGAGALTGSLVNAGTITLGRAADPTGTITVSGTFQQSATGVLNVELGGTAIADYDRLLVTGAATLLGTLNVVLAGGFVPAVGNTFDVLTFAAHVDDFDIITGLTPAGAPALQAVFENTRLRLRVI